MQTTLAHTHGRHDAGRFGVRTGALLPIVGLGLILVLVIL
jgi:hypothetical protein